MPAMPPPNGHVKFTTTPGGVVCQRCKVSFPQGMELHFLQDLTGEGPGKKVCEECRQYYITKTEKIVQSTTGKLLNEHLSIDFGINRSLLGRAQVSYSRQVTPGQLPTASAPQQTIRKAVAAAQREGGIFKK